MDDHYIPSTSPITTGGWAKKPLDRAARRYFVYTLADALNAPVYVGRSCNVANRIRKHVSEATHPYSPAATFKAFWLRDVRRVSMVGPLTWDEAVTEERRQIKSKLPRGNRIGMKARAS